MGREKRRPRERGKERAKEDREREERVADEIGGEEKKKISQMMSLCVVNQTYTHKRNRKIMCRDRH